jgi:hypothetical protein
MYLYVCMLCVSAHKNKNIHEILILILTALVRFCANRALSTINIQVRVVYSYRYSTVIINNNTAPVPVPYVYSTALLTKTKRREKQSAHTRTLFYLYSTRGMLFVSSS